MQKPIVQGYFKRYTDQVPENDLFDALNNQQNIIENFISGISEEKSMYSYAPGKWTLKELLLHMSDCERIFAYRILRFARLDETPLPGFDEDHFAANSNANSRSWQSIGEEFLAVRAATLHLLRSLSREAFEFTGTASENRISALALSFTLVGHVYHHLKVVEERYM